jgi:glycine/D-amino acid oxidase-like deaminating enzyme
MGRTAAVFRIFLDFFGENRMGTFKCDVFICGGSVLGLWLAGELRSRFSVVVAEPGRIGSGQASHSQAFIHQGFVRADRLSAQKYASTWQESWAPWLRAHGGEGQMPGQGTNTFFPFSNPGAFQRYFEQWTANGLNGHEQYKKDDVRNYWSTRIGLTAVTPDFGTEIEWLLAKLQNDVSDSIIGASVSSIRLTSDEKGFIVGIAPCGGCPYDVTAQAVVLAAGEGNVPLLKMFDPNAHRVGLTGDLVQERKTGYVLAIESEEGLLPFINVFALEEEFDYLFIVSRRPLGTRDGIQGRGTVWLVSDDEAWVNDSKPNAMTMSQWLRHIKNALPKVIHPNLLDPRRRYKCRAYEGCKIDPSSPKVVTDDHLASFGLCRRGGENEILQVDQRNLFLASPIRLSLVPRTAQAITSLLSTSIQPLFARAERPQATTQAIAVPLFASGEQLTWQEFLF